MGSGERLAVLHLQLGKWAAGAQATQDTGNRTGVERSKPERETESSALGPGSEIVGRGRSGLDFKRQQEDYGVESALLSL